MRPGMLDPIVEVDSRYLRPTEVDILVGDATKARQVLGWRHKTSFEELVSDMDRADLKAVLEERRRLGRAG